MGPSFAGVIMWLLVSLLTLSPPSHAQSAPNEGCECLWGGGFSAVAPNTDLVVLGSVTAVKGNAVDLSIERTLQGESWLDTVRIWMRARDFCRPAVDIFSEGSRWIMALERITQLPEDGFDPLTPNISFGRLHDYSLSSCGGYFLKATEDTALGNVVSSMPRWDYSPKMTPVLIDLIEAYLRGDTSAQALEEASREDPVAKSLMLDTKSFLRGQAEWLEQDDDN